MCMTTFDQVISFLDSFSYQNKQNAPGDLRNSRLDRMYAILALLNNPEKSFKAVHVAGSKGKGSTSAFLSYLLTKAGYKTGLFMSPHFTSYKERFTLNGTFFTDEEYVKAGKILKDNVVGLDFIPTTFEMYTAYAYILFKETGCTHAVIETGMGGRLDATNTLNSICSVITPIELEHTQVLGDTISKIALEKAKIIKKNQNVFISKQKEEAIEVFIKEAKEQGSTLYSISDEITSISSKSTKDAELVSISFKDGTNYNYSLKMIGSIQAENSALALLVAKKMEFFVENESLEALSNTVLPGRFQKVKYKEKTFIFDVAHTKNSLEYTLRTFNSLYPNRNDNAVIFGLIEGKNIVEMTKMIACNFNKIIVSRSGAFKKSLHSEIYEVLVDLDYKETITLLPKAEDALSLSIDSIDKDGAILVTGSFYLGSEIKEAMDNNEHKQ